MLQTLHIYGTCLLRHLKAHQLNFGLSMRRKLQTRCRDGADFDCLPPQQQLNETWTRQLRLQQQDKNCCSTVLCNRFQVVKTQVCLASYPARRHKLQRGVTLKWICNVRHHLRFRDGFFQNHECTLCCSVAAATPLQSLAKTVLFTNLIVKKKHDKHAVFCTSQYCRSCHADAIDLTKLNAPGSMILTIILSSTR